MVSSARVLAVSCGMVLLFACGGGPKAMVQPPSGTTSGDQVTVVGTLVGTPSALQIGGQPINTASAVVTVNGQPGTAQDLQPGVILRGKGARAGASIQLSSVDVRPDFCGPLTAIDVAGGIVHVLGTAVNVNALTVLAQEGADHAFTPLALEDFKVGDVVRVFGSLQSDGSFLATRIERRVPHSTSLMELRGLVSGLDATASTFLIGSISVSYGTATVRGILANGVQVEVGGSLSGTIFTAARVEVEQETGSDPGTAVEARGSLSTLNAVTKTFNLLAFTVDYSAAVVSGALVEGAVVEVEGTFSTTAANTILATRVEVKFGHHGEGASNEEAKGTITALNGVDLTFALGGITYWTDAHTVFIRTDAAIAFTDLKVGDRVEVRALSTRTNPAGQAYASRVEEAM